MNVPEGFKQTEVGVIPKDWEVVALGELTEKVGSGITPTGGQRVYKEGGRPFMRSQNVGWGSLLLDDVAFIDDAIHATFLSTEIQLHDVFLNITGASIGRSAIADSRVVFGNVNQHVCIIRTDNSKLSPRFLNYFLLSANGQMQIDIFQAGGNRQGLNFSQVRSIRIAKPKNIKEQTAIAAALGDMDALIEGVEKLLEKKRRIKQGAMQELLTGRTRLRGYSKKWETKKLGDIVILYREHIVPSKNPEQMFVHFSLPAFDAGRVPVVEIGSAIKSNKFRVPQYAVLVSKLNPRIPRIWTSEEIPANSIASTEFLVLLPSKQTNRKFLHFVCSSPVFCEKMESSATGTTGSHQRMNPKESLEISLDIPSDFSEQVAIAAILSDMDSEIEELETQLTKYRQLKTGMMQELLTGKKRLV